MTAKLSLSNERLVRYAVCPYWYTNDNLEYLAFPSTFRRFDFMLHTMESLNYYIPAGSITLKELTRMNVTREGKSDISVGLPVKVLDPGEIDFRARSYYRSFLDDVTLFDRILFGGENSIPSHNREHAVSHSTFRGDVIARATSLPEVDATVNFLDGSAPCKKLTNDLVNAYRITNTVDFDVEFVSSYDGHFRYSLIDLLDLLKTRDEWSEHLYGDGLHWLRSISKVEYHIAPAGLTIEWHGKVHTYPFSVFPDGEDTEYDGWAFVSFDVLPPCRTPEVGQTDYFSFGNVHTFGYHNAHRRHAEQADGPTAYYWYGSGGGPCIALSNPTASGSLSLAIPITKSLHDLSWAFCTKADAQFSDIVGASAFSATAALQDLEHSSGINILQNLQKIPDIASAVPQIKELIDVMSRVLRRDFRLSTFKEIIDLATSTKLQNDFQWQPYVKVFTEYLPAIQQVLTQRYDTRAEGRGKYFYRLPPGSLGRDACDLTVRTKIVIPTNYNSWLGTFLKIDGLGVIPKFSNLWDLIPFTFAVNWFTNVGRLIKNAEYSLLLHSVPSYYVHSYLLESPVSSIEMNQIGISDSSRSLPLTLRFYRRDYTEYSPTPRESKFGIGIPSQLPPLTTVGALIWQLIFS